MMRTHGTIVQVRMVTSTVIELTVARADGQPFFRFSPGQYATISFPDYSPLKSERSFSIASAPTQPATIQFGIRFFGPYTRSLRHLKIGDRVMVSGPYGKFTYDGQRDGDAVFLAGGIGITPFLSMIRAATDRQLPQHLTLLYSSRTWSDTPFREELVDLANRNQNFRVVFFVTDQAEVRTAGATVVSSQITRQAITRQAQGDLWLKTYYLCGPPPFMSAMRRTLASMGVSERSLRTEGFGLVPRHFLGDTSMGKVVLGLWGLAAVAVVGVVFAVDQQRRQVATPKYDQALVDALNATAGQRLQDLQQQAKQRAVQPSTPAPNANVNPTTQPTSQPAAPKPVVKPTPAPKAQPSKPKPQPVVPRTQLS